MDFHIEVEHVALVGRLLLVLVAAGIVVTKFIDGLKAADKIDDQHAGEWNQGVAFVVSLAIFALRQLGLDGGIPVAEAQGTELAALLVTTYSVAAVAKLVHKLVNWLEGRRTARPLH